MRPPGAPADPARQAQLIAELRRDRALRQQGYRERALRVLPHVCARCGRPFAGKRLSELTVHHRDHDFRHNPPDGSNWELLCLYCHDNEHEKSQPRGSYAEAERVAGDGAAPLANPFGKLDALIKPEPPAAAPGADAAPAAGPAPLPPSGGRAS